MDHEHQDERIDARHELGELRAYEAKAMQAWLSGHVAHYGHENFWALDAIAQSSYEMADAMLAARKVKS